MSTNSNDIGRAYEYAWMQSLYNYLSKKRNTTIVKNSSLSANERAWFSMTNDMQGTLIKSANAAVDMVVELESNLLDEAMQELTLEFQKDGRGVAGDVRDIVAKRSDINWQVGLSIKHNHEAIKHSRLSGKLDFGNEWFGNPCSPSYWKEIEPVFSMLALEKKNGAKWSDLNNKEKDVYVPLLKAFIDEVNRACMRDKTVPRKMIEYLIGIEDYYKVVSKDNKRVTLIHTFNMHKTLNQPSKNKVSTITVPVLELPTRIVALEFKPNSTNTVEMYLDNGWQLSFRIHNTSTKVETSLKFDIQFIGMPVSVLNIECRWH